jgi:hypothetical protein
MARGMALNMTLTALIIGAPGNYQVQSLLGPAPPETVRHLVG